MFCIAGKRRGGHKGTGGVENLLDFCMNCRSQAYS